MISEIQHACHTNYNEYNFNLLIAHSHQCIQVAVNNLITSHWTRTFLIIKAKRQEVVIYVLVG